MTKLSNAEKERLKKNNEMFLYNLGYNHVNSICDETDRLLEENKAIEIPERLDNWFKNYNKKFENKQRRKRITRKLLNYSKKIAVVLLAIVITFSVLTVTVEAFRTRLFNMIVQVNDKFSDVKFADDSNAMTINKELSGYYPSYLPTGYELHQIDENDSRKIIEYKKQNEYIYFSRESARASHRIDTEDAEVSTIYINGHKAMLSVKNRISIVIWNNGDYVFSVRGKLERAEIIKIAESVKYHKK